LANQIERSRGAYFWAASIATVLALLVIVLGAYTRLKDAGLGCPDWPGCYGQLTVPQTPGALAQAQQAFPSAKIEAAKAWPEMIHRYFASSLGVLIFVLAIWAILRAPRYPKQPVFIPLFLFALVIFQALLGMWTVTMLLLPLVVMSHLLGGMLIAGLLWACALASDMRLNRPRIFPAIAAKIKPWAILGLIIVFLQIFLGGWTSTNYAALACPTFPGCNGSLIPAMDFSSAFNFFSPIGINYEGGVLHSIARITIQMTHRYGALVTTLYLAVLVFYLLSSNKTRLLRPISWIILGLLILQLILGVLNVEWRLPLSIAVAHNGVAALLFLAMVTLVYKVAERPREIW
jgi:cytochrome c oxidase assembly protein subunit 15